MQYEIQYSDGSEEILEAANIRQARQRGQALYECGIRKVTALSDDDDEDTEADNPDDDDDEDEDEDDDEEEEDDDEDEE